jgi:integrative and conjugative element protein (TIGR02256 family)
MNSSLKFRVGDFDVEIDRAALDVFESHRQTRFYHREAGGQLFGRAVGTRWKVARATGPSLEDRRFRFGFRPDRGREQREINQYHTLGFDFLGDWHTHPEGVPTPSARDLDSIEDIVQKSTLRLPGLLLCIVGRHPFPTGIWLSMHPSDGGSAEANLTT